MIPHIAPPRQHNSKGRKPFNDLISYIEENKSQEMQRHLPSEFSDILNYATTPLDKTTNQEKCVAIRTHGIADLATAAIQMNAVSARNTRCIDPTFHFILSWHEHEHLVPDAIFDAAEHAIKSLGLGQHQYLIAIHPNTDNTHCHIAVNRIHPATFKSHNIEWAQKTLHMAARQSEIKHEWTHDNGIYIVKIDDKNKKSIVLNPDHDNTIPDAHRDHQKASLPTWHDPGGLDSWLKSKVAQSLKRDLPKLADWNALHTWLSQYDITLTDFGGAGMRLHATSPETEEILDLPISRGLRILKRAELEKRWGNFVPSIPDQPLPCIVPDLSHLTCKQLAKGVIDFLTKSHDRGIPPDHILRANQVSKDRAAGRDLGPSINRSGSLHELPASSLDADRQNGKLLLQGALHNRLGDKQTGQDTDLRRPGTGEVGGRGERSLTRDNSKREERKNQRAAARADLCLRFAQYKQFVRIGDIEHIKRVKEIRGERTQALKDIREKTAVAKSIIKRDRSRTLESQMAAHIGLDAFSLRQKMQVETKFQERSQSLRATRIPPLSWRVWLFEQANLGDQAALSALRGIVYQALRDAKGKGSKSDSVLDEAKEADTEEYRERQYKKAMARLLEEEKKEIAIRSARSAAMRPYEVDPLLARYAGIQWHVTGNGNVEYSQDGGHLFTDRGNRITFDRVRVSDEEIRLALIHAQQKFGSQLTLTGNDPDFTIRMASLADEMGMTVLNPELQLMIANHRVSRELQITLAPQVPTPQEIAMLNEPIANPAQAEPLLQEPEESGEEIRLQSETPAPAQTSAQVAQDCLRAKILSIDPHAKFVIPDSADSHTSDSHTSYDGPVAAIQDDTQGFAQRIGRGIYAIHPTLAPENHNNTNIEVRYQNGQPIITIPDRQKGKWRSD